MLSGMSVHTLWTSREYVMQLNPTYGKIAINKYSNLFVEPVRVHSAGTLL